MVVADGIHRQRDLCWNLFWRLCRAGTWSGFLGWLHLLSWQLIIVAGLLTLPRGITQGRVGGEVEWPIDLAITLVWILFFASTFS